MKRKISLLFDRHISYGSKEHYFHFMWGYLLPSIYLIIESKNDEQYEDITYCFDTCGPVMNKLINEVIELLSINAQILSREQFELVQDIELVPRWDIYLLIDYILNIDKKKAPRIHKLQTCVYLRHFLSTPDFKKNFKTKILKIKTLFWEHIIKHKDFKKHSIESSPVLIIRRSDIHPFYSNEGQAEKKGYGTSRRGLIDIDEYINKHKNQKVNIKSYEPGKHSLFHQIITFQNALGIVGIKGAEFANLLWLKEGTKVVMIKPSGMKSPNVQQKLCEILNLNFIELISDTGNHPSILTLEPITYFQ